MMKLRVEVIGYKKWIDNMMNNLAKYPVEAMMNVMSVIKGRAQTEYLRGPYPEHLRVGGSYLMQNIQPKVEVKLSDVIGYLTVASIAYYGLIWEAVGIYEHRKGKMFSGNDTPMCRPFAYPSYKDLAEWTVDQLSHSVVESSR